MFLSLSEMLKPTELCRQYYISPIEYERLELIQGEHHGSRLPVF